MGGQVSSFVNQFANDPSPIVISLCVLTICLCLIAIGAAGRIYRTVHEARRMRWEAQLMSGYHGAMDDTATASFGDFPARGGRFRVNPEIERKVTSRVLRAAEPGARKTAAQSAPAWRR